MREPPRGTAEASLLSGSCSVLQTQPVAARATGPGCSDGEAPGLPVAHAAAADSRDRPRDERPHEQIRDQRDSPVKCNFLLRVPFEGDKAGKCAGEEVRTVMDPFDDRVAAVRIDVPEDDRQGYQEGDQSRDGHYESSDREHSPTDCPNCRRTDCSGSPS